MESAELVDVALLGAPPPDTSGKSVRRRYYSMRDLAGVLNVSYSHLYRLYDSSIKAGLSRRAREDLRLGVTDAAVLVFSVMLREHHWTIPDIGRHVAFFRRAVHIWAEDAKAGRRGPWLLALQHSRPMEDVLLRGPEETSKPLHTYGPSGVWVDVEAVLAVVSRFDAHLKQQRALAKAEVTLH